MRKHRGSGDTSVRYRLTYVRRLVRKGRYIVWESVMNSVMEDFGWDKAELEKALLKLKKKHFYKSERCKVDARYNTDFYKGCILGEKVYMHFYIDPEDERLVLMSCKEDDDS